MKLQVVASFPHHVKGRSPRSPHVALEDAERVIFLMRSVRKNVVVRNLRRHHKRSQASMPSSDILGDQEFSVPIDRDGRIVSNEV